MVRGVQLRVAVRVVPSFPQHILAFSGTAELNAGVGARAPVRARLRRRHINPARQCVTTHWHTHTHIGCGVRSSRDYLALGTNLGPYTCVQADQLGLHMGTWSAGGFGWARRLFIGSSVRQREVAARIRRSRVSGRPAFWLECGGQLLCPTLVFARLPSRVEPQHIDLSAYAGV